MVEVHSGIKVVDDAIKDLSEKRRRSSILIMGRKAAETFVFQLAKSLCEKDESQSSNAKEFQTIYVNFNDSDENFLEKAKRVRKKPKDEDKKPEDEGKEPKDEDKKPEDLVDTYIDMYDRRSVGSIDNIVKEISDIIAEIKKKPKEESVKQIIIIVNSLSRLALYLEEDKVLDFLATMNYLEYVGIRLLVFFFLDDSLHEPLFINKVKSLVDGAIVFREDYEMEITENFFSLEGFGESSPVTKWYPCLDIEEHGIIPVESLELVSRKKLQNKLKSAEARRMIKYREKEGYSLEDDARENPGEWLEKKLEEYRAEREKMTFRTGIWAIDRIFSDEDNTLGGIEHFYGIAIYHDVPPIDMYPVLAKILYQCFEDGKPFIEISIDDTPDVFLSSLESHNMMREHKKIREELKGNESEREKSKFKFINSYGIKPSGELGKSDNIINIDNPYNVTIMFAKYREARDSLRESLITEENKKEENEIGPVIWLNSYTGLASVTSVENAYSFGVSTIMARDVWSPEDNWKSLMLFSMQKHFISSEDDANMLQALDGVIEFSSRRILGNRMYYFRVPKMPKTNKTVGWTPYKIIETLGFLSLDEDTIYHYLEADVLGVKGGESNV